jgi:hypothetical protein
MRYDFANAYRDALDMVETKKMSFSSGLKALEKGISDIFKVIQPTLESESISNVLKAAANIASGDVTADSILASYDVKSKFKDAVASGEKDETFKRDGKVITLDHLKKK